MPSFLRQAALSVAAASLIAGCSSPAQLRFDDSTGSDVTEHQDVAGGSVDDLLSQTDSVQPDEGDGVAADGSGDDLDPSASRESSPADTQEAVERAFARLIGEWTACYHRPGKCDASRVTAPTSPERQRLTESLAFYATEKMRTKPDEGRLQWGIESLSVTSNDRARIVTCEYDTRIFFDSSMADTEIGDIIFDTTVWTRRVEWTLAEVDGSWSLWQRRIEKRSPVARFCTP